MDFWKEDWKPWTRFQLQAGEEESAGASTEQIEVQDEVQVPTSDEVPAPASTPVPDPEELARKHREPLLNRISKLTAEREELKRRLQQATQIPEQTQVPDPAQTPDLNPKTGKLYTQAELDAAKVQGAIEIEFNNRCNKLAEDGKKSFPDFMDKVNLINSTFGVMSRDFIEAALETGTAEKVIYGLAKDLGEAERIFSLPPARQAVALAKYAAKFEASPKAVSNAPEPISPVVSGGGRISGNLYDDNLPTEEWIKLRNKQARKA